MSHGSHDPHHHHREDLAPGEERFDEGEAGGLSGYLIGLGFAVLLTAASFFFAGSNAIWGPGIPIALVVLAIAQMGVHLVFFLHITTSPDNTNNVMALAFGVLIVFLVIGGTVWIMHHLNVNMMSLEQMIRMQQF